MNLHFDCRHRYASGFELDIQFQANRWITALCGPSGSGKTTVLSLIAGLLRPTRGFVRIGDRVVTDVEKNIFVAPEKRNIGLAFQDYCLFPHMRVRANIAYAMRRRKVRRVPAERVIEEFQLEDILQRYPRSLSGGQQQRIALARAILAAPSLLMLDEPLTAVESSLRGRIARFVEQIASQFEIPTLLVTHDRELVQQLGASVIQIQNGRLAPTA